MKTTTLFTSQLTNIEYKLLETDNAVKILHLVNPNTKDFYISTVHKAGSIYDNMHNLPEGTAHMLEHMLIGNPNTILKTKEILDEFEKGNTKQPVLSINAQTTPKHIYFNVDTHSEGSLRAIKRLNYALNTPYELDKFLEKEKDIVLAERKRKPKREKDGFYHSLEFLFENHSPEFITNILGEEESIKAIQKEDLEVLYKQVCNTTTSVITIQSPKDLTEEELKELNLLTKDWSEEKILEDGTYIFPNEFKVGAFEEPRESGVSISFIYYTDNKSKINYKEEILNKAFKVMLWQIAQDRLREELGLIYGLQNFENVTYTWKQATTGFILTTSEDNLEETLQETHKILTKGFREYLDSKRGKEVFESYLSTYIFHKTIQYNKYRAESIGAGFLRGEEIYNINKDIEAAKKLTIQDMVDHLKKTLLEKDPHIWVVSSEDTEDMIEKIMESPFNVRIS